MGGALEAIKQDEWQAVARWLDYAADEFASNESMADYLRHIAECVRDEAGRRFGGVALASV